MRPSRSQLGGPAADWAVAAVAGVPSASTWANGDGCRQPAVAEPPGGVWAPSWGRQHGTTGLLPGQGSADWVGPPQPCAPRPVLSCSPSLPPHTWPVTHSPSREVSLAGRPQADGLHFTEKALRGVPWAHSGPRGQGS